MVNNYYSKIGLSKSMFVTRSVSTAFFCKKKKKNRTLAIKTFELQEVGDFA